MVILPSAMTAEVRQTQRGLALISSVHCSSGGIFAAAVVATVEVVLLAAVLGWPPEPALAVLSLFSSRTPPTAPPASTRTATAAAMIRRLRPRAGAAGAGAAGRDGGGTAGKFRLGAPESV